MSQLPTHRHAVSDIPMQLLSPNGAVAEVSAEFRYSTRDPFAVQATFTRPAHAPVVWVFARDLLLTGVAQHAGDGDVQIYPADDRVVFELNSPEGSARLAAARTEVRSFVARILTLVSPGNEGSFVDIDVELDQLARSIFAGGDA